MSRPSCSTFVAVAVFIMPVVLGANQTGSEGPDLNPKGPCKAALERLCAHVSWGSGRQAQCLREQTEAALNRKQASPVTPGCKAKMQKFFIEGAQNGTLKEPVSGFKAACKSDIEKHCKGRPKKEKVPCLKNASRNNQLEPPCFHKLMELRVFEAKDMRLDVVLMGACKSDLQRISACNGEGLPHAGARKACLKKHKNQITAACSAALFARAQEDAEDIRLKQPLFAACRTEIGKFCRDKEYGEARIIKCLWQMHTTNSYSEECKQKVTKATREKVSDYRLDFRVQKHCQDDIKELCAKEKATVDSLTVDELFANGTTKGRSGLVLHCLKKNYQRLAGSPCKKEILHVVRVHALDPTSDPIFRRQCSTDMSRHCGKVAPEMAHFCLRNHFADLTQGCKEAAGIQGKLAGSDIAMKPKMETLCKREIETLCKMSAADGQVIACLQDRMLESGVRGSPFSEQCKEIVQKDIIASNHDWQLKFGLHQACNVEAGRLCSEQLLLSSSQVLPCLKSNADKVEDADCKKHVNRVIRQGAANILAAPDTYAACINDVQAHCSEVRPGQGRINKCLLNHRNSLSQNCAQAQFKVQQQIAEDARRHPQAQIVCANAWKKLCPEVVFGNGAMWRCMQSKKDNPEMSRGCWAIVTSEERLRNFEFFLNPELSRDCKSEATTLCPFEATMAERKDFKSNGKVINCLIRSRTRISKPECAKALHAVKKERLSDVKNAPDAVTSCTEDEKKYCPNVRSSGQGEMWKCLRRQINDISAVCRKIVADYMRVESEDFTLMVGMQKQCATARERFCKREPDHTGRVVMCMMEHMHESAMEPGCRKKLVEQQGVLAKSHTFNPLVAKSCKDEVEHLYEVTKDVRCQPHDDVVSGLSGRGLSCLTSHHQQIRKAKCKQAVKGIVRLQSNDMRAVAGMLETCKQAVQEFCHEVSPGKGRMHDCLRKRIGEIKQPECVRMVNQTWTHEKEDATMNPQVRAQCHNELDAYCQGIKPGEHRVLVCLKHYESSRGFGEACKEVVKSIGVDATFLETAQESAFEVLKGIHNSRQFWDRWGIALILSTFFLVLSSCVAVGVLLRRACRARPTYSIEVEQGETLDPEAAKDTPQPQALGKGGVGVVRTS